MAVMLPCLGAWAQKQAPKPVLELQGYQIGTYPYELNETDANKVFNLESLTIAVQINTSTVSGRMALFATSDPTKASNGNTAEGMNSRYVAYGMYDKNLSYLASWRGGDRFTAKTNILTANTEKIVAVYVVSPTSFKCYVNGVEQMAYEGQFMNGYEIATPKMVKEDHQGAKIYIGGGKNSGGNSEVFNGTIRGVKVYSGALTAEEIAAISFPSCIGYIRLQGASNNYIDASSIYNNATAKTGQMSMKSDATCNLAGSIFYCDENNKLLNYATGTYVTSTREIGNINSNANTWTISASSIVGKSKIKSNDNNWLHDNSGNRADRCSSDPADHNETHSWTLEKVTSLPVTITTAKYATFYAPVAVEVADGVTAYSVTINGEWATLNEIESGIIPANTGVVLYADVNEATTYNLAITEDVEAIASDLRGSAATTYYTTAGTYYALGLVDGKVGFYKDAFKNNRFQNNSHKAYLYIANTQGAQALRFNFGGTTGIEEAIVAPNANEAIYDLSGRRVMNAVKGGIYIKNGKKFIVK